MKYYCYYDSKEDQWSHKCWKRLGDLKNHFHVRGVHLKNLEDFIFYCIDPDTGNKTFKLRVTIKGRGEFIWEQYND